MKKNICKIFLIMTAIAFGLAGCSAEAKVERQLELGASSMEAGDYDAAIEAYEEVIALDKYEIEGYEGLVAAMVADGRSSEEIVGVVASATDVITELKESEDGLSEEDKAAAERLYINAANAVADDKDAQVSILEKGAGVLEESSALKEAYKEAADENTDETTEDAQNSTDATAGDSSNENAGDGSNENGQDALVMETEFGYISCLGANAEYPDVFEDFEIEINGQVILVSLPKGMCTHYNWYAEDNALSLQNADGSKWMYIFHTDFTQTEEGKEVCATFTTETFKSAISYDGYTNIPETEVLTTLINEEKLLVNYIGCNIENYCGNVLYYRVYNEKVEDFYDGIKYNIYYGETRECDFTADFVVESFKIKDVEESIIENSKPTLNEDGTLIDAEKYGIPSNLVIPTCATVEESEGYIYISIPYENEEDFIIFLNDFNNITPITERTGITIPVFSGENVVDAFKKDYTLYFSYVYNDITYEFWGLGADCYYIALGESK